MNTITQDQMLDVCFAGVNSGLRAEFEAIYLTSNAVQDRLSAIYPANKEVLNTLNNQPGQFRGGMVGYHKAKLIFSCAFGGERTMMALIEALDLFSSDRADEEICIRGTNFLPRNLGWVRMPHDYNFIRIPEALYKSMSDSEKNLFEGFDIAHGM